MGGGCLRASGGMPGCPHTCAHACACMHMHACTCAHTHMYTCMEIANGHNMEASMFIMFNMHVYMAHPTCPHQAQPQSTHPPLPLGAPGISKNSITVELIKIIQFCLTM